MLANARPAVDWLGSFRAGAGAWRLPQLAIVAALFLPPAIRMMIWVTALAWMETACIFNSCRCDPAHCRFTGPYYLALILPTLRVTPAMAAGMSDRLWEVFDIVALVEAEGSKLPTKRDPYRRKAA